MSQTTSLSTLLGGAGLDPNATSKMMLTADTLGPAIQAGLGDITIDDITTSEVVLVTLLLDNSGSIRMGSNSQAVRDGHNGMIEALKAAKQSASVLVSCRYLNEEAYTNQCVLYPYRQLDDAEQLTASNFNPMGGTPLYDQTAITLVGVTAKLAEFEQGGVAARAVTYIVTDGGDAGSYQHNTNDVFKMVRGMLGTEQHIIGGMGVDDGYTDFRKVFRDMGIPDEWVLTPGDSPSEIRKAFAVVSQSAVRASQAAGGSFSQVALGGFGAP